MCHEKKIKFENYRNYLEAFQLDNKLNYQEKKKLTEIIFKKS